MLRVINKFHPLDVSSKVEYEFKRGFSVLDLLKVYLLLYPINGIIFSAGSSEVLGIHGLCKFNIRTRKFQELLPD